MKIDGLNRNLKVTRRVVGLGVWVFTLKIIYIFSEDILEKMESILMIFIDIHTLHSRGKISLY
jgi:hypothetical protein